MLNRPSPAPSVVAEDLDTELSLYRTDIDEALVLNQTAGDVWRLADGTATVGEIVTQLAHAYSSSAAELEGSVHEVIDDLARRGYLTEAT